MTPPVAGFVLLPVTNGASAENGASSHFQTSGALGAQPSSFVQVDAANMAVAATLSKRQQQMQQQQ